MRAVATLAFAFVGLGVVVACGSTSALLDGGCLADDAGYDADEAGFIIDTMNPPHAPEHACTTLQLSDYAQCQGAKNDTLCQQFRSGGSSTGCAACMESQAGDPTWGVIVFSAQAGSFNVEGCVDLELGQTNTTANKSCGELLHESYQCQNQANAALCNTCVGDASIDCIDLVLNTACKSQNDAVLDPNGPCAVLFSEAAPPAALTCFPNTTLADDPQQQEVNWLLAVGGIFCGP